MWIICESTGTTGFLDRSLTDEKDEPLMEEKLQVPPDGRVRVSSKLGEALVAKYPVRDTASGPSGFREASGSDDRAEQRLQMFESRAQRAEGPVEVETEGGEGAGEPAAEEEES